MRNHIQHFPQAFPQDPLCELPVKISRIPQFYANFKLSMQLFIMFSKSLFSCCIYIHNYAKMRKIINLPHFVYKVSPRMDLVA